MKPSWSDFNFTEGAKEKICEKLFSAGSSPSADKFMLFNPERQHPNINQATRMMKKKIEIHLNWEDFDKERAWKKLFAAQRQSAFMSNVAEGLIQTT